MCQVYQQYIHIQINEHKKKTKAHTYTYLQTYTHDRFKFTLNLYLKFNDNELCFARSSCTSLCLTHLVNRTLVHTLKEVIDIFTGTQQSAARVHEGHTKTIVKTVPLPSPTFPTTTIVSHTYRACLFLLFVRHFMENKHTRTANVLQLRRRATLFFILLRAWPITLR